MRPRSLRDLHAAAKGEVGAIGRELRPIATAPLERDGTGLCPIHIDVDGVQAGRGHETSRLVVNRAREADVGVFAIQAHRRTAPAIHLELRHRVRLRDDGGVLLVLGLVPKLHHHQRLLHPMRPIGLGNM